MKKIAQILFLLLFSSLLYAQWHIVEGFESPTLPAGWRTYDDGDGLIWRPFAHSYAHSGERAAIVDNYFPNQNADWLITPQISVNYGDILQFYTRAWYGTEELKVYVSTTSYQPSSFSTLLLHLQDIGTGYTEGLISLDSFAGMDIYIAFFWQCQTYAILLDDVKIGQPPQLNPELNLPASVSFFNTESFTLDFSEYIVCTDPSSATLSCADNEHIDVEIDGLTVSLFAPDFIGETQLVFTLTDELTNLSAVDTLQVIVLEHPAVDLYISQVLSPRAIEYLNIPFQPRLLISNAGHSGFENSVAVQLNIYDSSGLLLLHTDTAEGYLNLAPSESAVLSFDNSFTPPFEGELRYQFLILTQDSWPENNSLEFTGTVILRITGGGPDSFGYRFVDSNDPLGPAYDWIEISQTGTSTITYNVSGFYGDDNFSEPIPLGFSFPFYGQNYTSAYVDTNGEILLGENSWHIPYPSYGWDNDGNMFNYAYPIPGYTQMPGLIAVYWDDLLATEGASDVYFQSFGEAPLRYTVIQWDKVRFLAGSGGDSSLKFQLILYENGDIKMQYHTVATGQSGANVPHDDGRSATVAIQNVPATSGLVYLREMVVGGSYQGVEPAGNLLHEGLAILFYSGEDEQAPIITHKEAGNSFFDHISIDVNVIDMSLPVSLNFFYDLGFGWQELSTQANQSGDYSFTLNSLTPNTTVRYYFKAVDALGNTAFLPALAPDESYSFKILPTNDAQVLIAYSGNQDYRRTELPLYEQILSSLGINYDIYDWEEYQGYQIPGFYQGIIAYASSGSANDKMQYFASQLINYLDSGSDDSPKNLFFASDNLASSQHAHSNASNIRKLMSGYFRTFYVATGFGGGTNGLAGPNSFEYSHGTILALPSTPVGTAGSLYPVYANSPDCIFPESAAGDPYYDDVPYPEIGANYAYAFEGGPADGQAYLYHGVCATYTDTPSFKTFYFSFDFSQLENPIHQNSWLSDLMDWWNIHPLNADDPAIPATQSRITRIYPNPFNPMANISYQLSQSAPVKLSVYNLKGQKVKDLADGFQAAGNYYVQWDGTDTKSDPVAGGVYFLKLKTPTNTSTQKLLLLK